MAPSAVISAALAVESPPSAEEEVISYSSLQRVNPNKEDRRRINLYLKQRMERLEAQGKIERAKCDVCMRLGHPYYACPYLRSVKEGTPLGPGWKITCKTCLEDDCLPGDKYVHRHAVKIYCAICCCSLMHSTIDRSKLTPEGRNNILKNAKRSKAMCEELAFKRAALGLGSQ